MRKFSWNKFLNISLIVATFLIIGTFLGVTYFNKPVKNVNAAPLIEGIPFKVGVMERTSTAIDDEGKFKYNDGDPTYSGNLETVNDGEYVMLYNYNAEKNVSSETVNVENIYISFGEQEVEKYVTYLRVYVKLNGKPIVVDSVREYQSVNLPNNISNAYYWYDYFDAKNYGEGLYEFQFDYSYAYNGNNYTGYTYNYSFYLLDQCRYDEYPTLNNTNEGSLDSTNIKQYYYNYTNNNLASLQIDASRYNISYTREKNKDTETVTSTFTVDPNTKYGKLTLTKTILGSTSTQVIDNIQPVTVTKGKAQVVTYPTTLYLDDLGTYTFTIKYLLQTGSDSNSEYVVIDNIYAYDVNEPGYENGTIQKGKLKLHIFGIKAYFTKNNGTELKQTDGGTIICQADVTSKLYNSGTVGYENKFDLGFKNSLLADFDNYPKTNLAPVYFDYYSAFSFNGNQPLSKYRIYTDSTFKTVKESGYITKDTTLDTAGYYEIIINYTYDLYTEPGIDITAGSQIQHSQAFIFQIDNSTPEVKLYKTTVQLEANILKNNAFTKEGVSASWNDTSYFQAPITAEYSQYNFDEDESVISQNQAYEKGTIIGNGSNGKYYLRVYFTYSEDVYVEYSFTIDNTPISDIHIQPIYAIKDINNKVTGYGIATDTNEVNFNNSTIINQPFTLTYSQKDSGAQIKTTYYKIPFAYNNSAGTIKNVNDKLVVENDYVIDADNMSSGIDYSLDYSSVENNMVANDNAFLDDKSYIYLFEMIDEAGNSATKYIIYDLTKPYVIVDADAKTPEIDQVDNPYGIVTKEAKLTWGDFKGVKVNAVVLNEIISNSKLQSIINSEQELFKNIDNSYYMCVPINKFNVTYTNTSNGTTTSETLTLENSSYLNSVTLYPVAPEQATSIQKFFSGDNKIYTYTITDASHITSATNIAKSNIKSSFIRMFLDNAQGIAYGNFGTSLSNTNSVADYESMVEGTTSANQLRFTYIPGEEGSDYYVKSLTYTYYDYSTESYLTLDTTLNEDKTYINGYEEAQAQGIPYPKYPFNKTATIENKSIAITDLKVNKNGETQLDRVVTEILNPVSEGGSIVTKPGMYVIKREYEAQEGGDYTYDSIIRYYVYYVDRNGIIEIDSSVTDENIYQSTRADMLYETGSGIIFNFSNPDTLGNYDTYYTALQIQQYLAFASSTIFDSNKLPINLLIPLDKYNSKTTLNQSTDASQTTSYVNAVSTENSTNYQLRYKITVNDSRITGGIVFDNTGDETILNSSYVTIINDNGFRSLRFVSEGTYNISLYDTADNRDSQKSDETKETDINKQKNNSYSFVFAISHESPNGEYYSKYDDDNRTDMILNAKSSSTNTVTYKSLNNDSLRFRFRKNDDKYRAEIDPTKIVVQKKIGNNTTTIFDSGVSTNTDVLTFVPDSVSSTGEQSETGYYILTIFDEYEYQQNGKAYLGGTGSTRDYLASKTQNIEYIINLQYVGNESDYIVNTNNTTVNYYKRSFNIVLDRIKPQYNYATLISLDNQKFAASESLDQSRMDEYFFTVNENFDFIQNSNVGGVLDSTELYIRHLEAKSDECDYPEYYKTFTPDDDNYYEEGNTSHIRFSESNPDFSLRTYDVDGKLNAPYAFSDGRGYYEVVERDEAGNYKVYAVYYNPGSVSNVINFEYEPAIKSGTNQDENNPETNFGKMPYEENNEEKRTIEILGNNLKFTSINDLGTYNNDYFYKCIIEYNRTRRVITNNPNDRQNSNSWTEFLNLINNELAFTDVVSKEGYKITITFVNRLSENYVFTYRVPGDRLEPIFTDISSSQFTITIPYDNNSTYIKEFHVWKFTNGTWIEQSQDSLGNTIVKSYSTGASLQGRTYTFGLGEFKFQLIDVFERGRDQEKYPPYYKGMGVNDVRTINYGTNVVVNDVAHTASIVNLNYQTNLYLLSIYPYNNETQTYGAKLLESEFANYGVTEQSIVNGVRTLNFENKNKNTIKQFKVELVVEKTNTKYTYYFAINKTLPEIELRNLSGGKLITSSNYNEPTIHTENFIVAWDTNDAFNAQVNLKREYIDASGKQQTEYINNIANGYEVGLSGTYTASISNSLGYTDTDYNIYFKLVSGEIVVYDVVTINNGVEQILRPSPKTSTIEIGEVTKILYRYYALESFNNPTGSQKYIEIRANKNKGIEYELLTLEDNTEETINEEPTEGEGEDTTSTSRIYRIYGASNYGYERYIEILFVDETSQDSGLTLTNITATYPIDEAGAVGTLDLNAGEVKTNVERIDLKWKAYNLGINSNENLRGNLIYLDYYFNGQFIRTIYSDSAESNSLSISTAGIHKFKLYDLAGNQQYFGLNNELVINLVNDVLFTINGEEPMNNQIFNSEVILEITNRYLYFTDPTITATLNGTEFTPDRVGTSFYQYKFTDHGYYEVTISTKISQNESVTTKYCFTIINKNIALPCFSIPQNSNFEIVKLLKQNLDITHTLQSTKELWLSPASFGTGNYTITLRQFNEALNKNIDFTFEVWINNEVPYIFSSTTFGTSTTSNIILTYNPKIIYDQIGESYISITGQPYIIIDANSPNEITSYTLTEDREYWIQIYSADDKLITSYKIIKKEPLNTTSIIIIVVVSVIVVALIVVFIVIRRHLKFR